MAIDKQHIGKSYGPYRYTLGLEKMREFAYAISGGQPSMGFAEPPPGLNPLLYDEAKAKDGPYRAVIAFPSFAVTFAIRPFRDALTDPQVGIDYTRVVHGEQDLEFFDVMRAGDVMTTTGRIAQIIEKAGMSFLTVETESVNQHGKRVIRGTWTAVIRGR